MSASNSEYEQRQFLGNSIQLLELTLSDNMHFYLEQVDKNRKKMWDMVGIKREEIKQVKNEK